jgi:hypothetical protein
VEGFRRVLSGMINESDRAKVMRSVLGQARR